MKTYLGIDIGGTAVKMAMVKEDGTILVKCQYPVSFDNYETPILTTVVEKTELFIKENPIEFESICVSATGQINVNTGEVIGTGGNIKNYENSQIKKELEEKFQKPTKVINDANSAMLGEYTFGRGKGCKNAIMITLGTGVGGGIMVDGRILLGKDGLAGEIGHFSIDANGKKCTCGNHGCLEQYASVTALIKMVKDETGESLNGLEIFQRKDEEKISDIIEKWTMDISTALVSLVHIFAPEVIIIGGAVSKQQSLIDNISKIVKSKSMKNFSKDLKITNATLGNDAGVMGAVAFYLSVY